MFWKRDKRAIFSYFDGQRRRKGDPLVLWRGMWNHETCDIEKNTKYLDDGNAPAKLHLQAMAEMSAAVRDVFGIKPLEEGGLTEAECVGVWFSLCEYTAALKKNGNH